MSYPPKDCSKTDDSKRCAARSDGGRTNVLSILLLLLATSCNTSDKGMSGESGGTTSQGGAGSMGGATGGRGGSSAAGDTNTNQGGTNSAGGSTEVGGAPSGGGAGAGGLSSGGGGVAGGVMTGGGGAGGSASTATGGSAGGVISDGGGSAGTATGLGGRGTDSGMPATGVDGGVVAPVISGGVRWIGRVDLSSPSSPKFAWSGSGFVATVAGPTISVSLRSDGGTDPVFFQPVIDGTPGTRLSVAASDGAKTLTLGSGLSTDNHVVELYRETEGKAGFAYTTFLGFVAGTLKDPPAYGGRLIEIVGDSISAGYGDLGTEQHPNFGPDPTGGCTFSTLTESAYVTYGAVAARALGADASIIAASGWGIYSDNLGNLNNVLPDVYANTVGGQPSPPWKFAVEPQAVIINLGTNDFSANMSLGADAFTAAYRGFLGTVRAKYPRAWVYCAIGPLLFGTGLTNATAYINALVTATRAGGDTRVKVLDLGQQNSSLGTGCSYHPNVTEQQRMGGILTTELRATLGW